MKAVLISIQPKWVQKIMTGDKTIEVRKTVPKIAMPFKVYIYCTKGESESLSYADYCGYDMTDFREDFLVNGKVVAEFVCDRVYQYASDMFQSAPVEGTDISTEEMTKLSCLTAKELYDYEHSTEPKENCINLIGVYGWHISDLKIYDEPKELSAFRKPCVNDLYCEECGMYSENTGICGNGALRLTRPPQSWCYVEELTDGK